MARTIKTHKIQRYSYRPQPQPSNNPQRIQNVQIQLQDNDFHLIFGDFKLNLNELQIDLPLTYIKTKILAANIPDVINTYGGNEVRELIFEDDGSQDHTVVVQLDLYSVLYASPKLRLRPKSAIHSVELNRKCLNRLNQHQHDLNSGFNLYYLDKLLIKSRSNKCSIKYYSQIINTLGGLSICKSHFIKTLSGASPPIHTASIISSLKLLNIPVFLILRIKQSNSVVLKTIKENQKLSLRQSKKRIVNLLNKRKDDDIRLEEIHLSLTDPLTLARILEPLRFKHCKHTDCFELRSITTFQKLGSVECPVCNSKISTSVKPAHFEYIINKVPKHLDVNIQQSFSIPLLPELIYDEYVAQICNSHSSDSVTLLPNAEIKSSENNLSSINLTNFAAPQISSNVKHELVDLTNPIYNSKKNSNSGEIIDLTTSYTVPSIQSALPNEVISLL
eukprot:NODE_10_length_61504_cov_0.956502.p15 type:complete len:447 gc:universal NODE_10_length_61504_cov_0.956502:28716-27376(-)